MATGLNDLEKENGIDVIVQKKDQELAVLRKEHDQQEYTERRHRKQLKHVQREQIKLKKQLDYAIKVKFCDWDAETKMLKKENEELRREKDETLKAKNQLQEANEKLIKKTMKDKTHIDQISKLSVKHLAAVNEQKELVQLKDRELTLAYKKIAKKKDLVKTLNLQRDQDMKYKQQNIAAMNRRFSDWDAERTSLMREKEELAKCKMDKSKRRRLSELQDLLFD